MKDVRLACLSCGQGNRVPGEKLASNPKCGTCGASLFWEPLFHDWTAVAMGAFDGSTRTRLTLHIFVADKGDYYDIADGLPQNPQ